MNAKAGRPVIQVDLTMVRVLAVSGATQVKAATALNMSITPFKLRLRHDPAFRAAWDEGAAIRDEKRVAKPKTTRWVSPGEKEKMICIDPHLHERVKQYAAQHGRRPFHVTDEAIRRFLDDAGFPPYPDRNDAAILQ